MTMGLRATNTAVGSGSSVSLTIPASAQQYDDLHLYITVYAEGYTTSSGTRTGWPGESAYVPRIDGWLGPIGNTGAAYFYSGDGQWYWPTANFFYRRGVHPGDAGSTVTISGLPAYTDLIASLIVWDFGRYSPACNTQIEDGQSTVTVPTQFNGNSTVGGSITTVGDRLAVGYCYQGSGPHLNSASGFSAAVSHASGKAAFAMYYKYVPVGGSYGSISFTKVPFESISVTGWVYTGATWVTPAAPTGLTVTPVCNAFDLSWTQSDLTNVTGYKIYYKKLSALTWSTRTISNPATTTFHHIWTSNPLEQVCYYVVALNQCMESLPTLTVCATMPCFIIPCEATII